MVGKCGARRRYIRLHHMKDTHNNGWGVYWVSRWIYLFIVWRHPASLRLRVWSGSCWAENHRIKHCMRLHGYTAQTSSGHHYLMPWVSLFQYKQILFARLIKTRIWYIEVIISFAHSSSILEELWFAVSHKNPVWPWANQNQNKTYKDRQLYPYKFIILTVLIFQISLWEALCCAMLGWSDCQQF